MTSKIVVKVTKKDIKEGVCGSPTLCPISRAVRRQTKQRVYTDTDTLRVGRMGHGGRQYDLPPVATDFIWEFDGGSKVKPITFTVTQ